MPNVPATLQHSVNMATGDVRRTAKRNRLKAFPCATMVAQTQGDLPLGAGSQSSPNDYGVSSFQLPPSTRTITRER